MMNIFKKIKSFYVLNFAKIEKKSKYYRNLGMKVGENCQIFSRVSMGSEPYLIEIGDNVKITNGCKFITHDGGVNVIRNLYPELKKIDSFGKIKVGNNVFFGNDCLILPNVTIGDNVVIGARAVVTRDIPANSVAIGSPARVNKTIEEYKNKVLMTADFTKDMKSKEKEQFLIKKYNNKND